MNICNINDRHQALIKEMFSWCIFT
jgi:hypothetical protein